MNSISTEPIQYARLADGIVVIRVTGKATHLQSGSLLYIFEKTRQEDPPPRYIIDLDQCTTMDSTFMGTLASIGLYQRREHDSSVIVTNIQEHVRYLLTTLGLQYILDMRPDKDGALDEKIDNPRFEPADAPEISTMERIVMMIEAHERLLNINSSNEVKFEGVLKTLRESLEREQKRM